LNFQQFLIKNASRAFKGNCILLRNENSRNGFSFPRTEDHFHLFRRSLLHPASFRFPAPANGFFSTRVLIERADNFG